MAPEAWAYASGGAADEITLRRNRAGFDDLSLRGLILEDLAGGGTRRKLFGHTFDSLIFLAPVAELKLAHPAGEIAAALGAEAAGAAMT